MDLRGGDAPPDGATLGERWNTARRRPIFGLASDVTITPGAGAWFVDEQAGRLVRLDASGVVIGAYAVPPIRGAWRATRSTARCG